MSAGAVRPPGRLALGEVVLERWRERDLPLLVAAVEENREHLRPWMAWAGDHDPKAAERYLAECEAGWTQRTRFEYSIRGARDRDVRGSAGLMARIDPGGLEIGYWLDRRWTGRGIATLTAAALSEAAFALVGISHVEIRHDQRNVASGGVPPRLGFRMVGTFQVPAQAPADVGRDIHWRMEAHAFAAGPGPALLAAARG